MKRPRRCVHIADISDVIEITTPWDKRFDQSMGVFPHSNFKYFDQDQGRSYRSTHSAVQSPKDSHFHSQGWYSIKAGMRHWKPPHTKLWRDQGIVLGYFWFWCLRVYFQMVWPWPLWKHLRRNVEPTPTLNFQPALLAFPRVLSSALTISTESYQLSALFSSLWLMWGLAGL